MVKAVGIAERPSIAAIAAVSWWASAAPPLDRHCRDQSANTVHNGDWTVFRLQCMAYHPPGPILQPRTRVGVEVWTDRVDASFDGSHYRPEVPGVDGIDDGLLARGQAGPLCPQERGHAAR
ncbi:hypothetical protein COU18_01050 [Candidatus Kaiserbacteria bacterium CG10_big_fil_rev_8_21_14_0_10_51_14]|uniref:Uncharacterized protein n=1 Tax=Candidatus Kaiserbacteria bacterium CG10_big_fil_rev_8_21_14_0_10_51_14 TaxID=1974610 RepID=A0A2H0UC31_9BACT|nr:MAG: hypothetical protein COU18_01050 [Candidatus Kaiserbacteria bacterium CG10_big_fil_rev_8_21_14_0_10_51_14]